MKFVYLDESGISNQQHEPTVVVAGVMIDADRQWLSVESRLEEIMRKFAPACIQEHGVCFHAKELYSGGKIWDREKIGLEQRFKILKKLCQIPSMFGLPVFYGSMRRELIADTGTVSPNEVAKNAQGLAAIMCMLQIEKYMRENAEKGEIAALVFEQNKDAEKLIKNSHFKLRYGPRFPGEWGGLEKYQPITRIIDTPHFVEKSGSSIVQIADVLAFFLKKAIAGDERARPFFNRFKGQLFGVGPELAYLSGLLRYRLTISSS